MSSMASGSFNLHILLHTPTYAQYKGWLTGSLLSRLHVLSDGDVREQNPWREIHTEGGEAAYSRCIERPFIDAMRLGPWAKIGPAIVNIYTEKHPRKKQKLQRPWRWTCTTGQSELDRAWEMLREECKNELKESGRVQIIGHKLSEEFRLCSQYDNVLC